MTGRDRETVGFDCRSIAVERWDVGSESREKEEYLNTCSRFSDLGKELVMDEWKERRSVGS